MEELRKANKTIGVKSVKQIIQAHREWQAKLKRDIFSDANITKAIEQCQQLFSVEKAGE